MGDQLFRYITVRTLAEDKEFDWIIHDAWNFKGVEFMNNLSLPLAYIGQNNGLPIWNEKETKDENGLDIRSYDPEINFVEDNTIIDGSFEDDKYWRHNLKNINEWLKVEPLEVPDDLCVIGFRGGEYRLFPELFLPRSYYDEGITRMRHINPNMRFQVHTDDAKLAEKFFPEFEVIPNHELGHSKHSNMALNWRATRFAKYAIIPNSAFYILPRILRHQDGEALTYAPRYWARHNQKTWARPANYYKEFTYLT